MELHLRISAQESGRMQVSITQDRLELALGVDRRISFEGVFCDIAVKLLTEEVQPTVSLSSEEVSAEEVPVEEPEQSSPLFQKLVALRRQIASEEGHPPFIIFHDNTLSEMCRVLPKDLQELKAIPGIGEAKLLKYGQRFLDAINN